MNLATPEMTLKLDEWPKVEGHDVEFTLVYDGPLYGASGDNPRAAHKHEIRKKFHPQLRNLWQARLQHWLTACTPSPEFKKIYAGPPFATSLAAHFAIGGFGFVPLVLENMRLACRLDILFLRRDSSRAIIKSGDIDNRLKTLFDALRVPRNAGELGSTPPGTDESPFFFVLLEDDSLITEVHVSTDTLLTPTEPNEPQASKLVIGVKLRPFQHTEWNISFL